MFKKARQSVVFKSFIQGFFNRMLNMKYMPLCNSFHNVALEIMKASQSLNVKRKLGVHTHLVCIRNKRDVLKFPI